MNPVPKLPQGPLGRALAGNAAAPAVDTNTASGTSIDPLKSNLPFLADSFHIPIQNPISGAVDLVQGGADGIKNIGDKAIQEALANTPQIPIVLPDGSMTMVKGGEQGLKELNADPAGVLKDAPKLSDIPGLSRIPNLGALDPLTTLSNLRNGTLPSVPGFPSLSGLPGIPAIPGVSTSISSVFNEVTQTKKDVDIIRTRMTGIVSSFLTSLENVSSTFASLTDPNRPPATLPSVSSIDWTKLIKITLVALALTNFAMMIAGAIGIIGFAAFAALVPVFWAGCLLLAIEFLAKHFWAEYEKSDLPGKVKGQLESSGKGKPRLLSAASAALGNSTSKDL